VATQTTSAIHATTPCTCWRSTCEIIRRDQRFLDLGEVELTKDFFKRLDATAAVIAADHWEPVFRLFRGQQRAIGELMLLRAEESAGSRYEAMGYAAFCQRLDNDSQFAGWFARLRADVDAMAVDRAGAERLVRLQHELIDLIELLDPKGERLASQHRSRIVAADVLA
jgi:hypothetical protein